MAEIPKFEVEFTKDGQVFDTKQVDAVLASLPQFSDLIIFSHGWNNDKADARALSNDFLAKAQDVLDGGIIPGAQGRTFGAVIVLWPSKKFTDEELIPGGGAATTQLQEDFAPVERILEELKNDPERLGETNVTETRNLLMEQAKKLLPQLKANAGARLQYVSLLRTLVAPDDAHADDGSLEFFTSDPEQMFKNMSDSVAAPVGPNPGGSARLAGQPGGAAGLKDIVDGVMGAARRIANFTTYYQMKERAGLVGRAGLSQVVRRIRQQRPAIRLHLVGHSFGGRLVTAAANALDPNTGSVTLTLLQAAYSHNGLAQEFDGTNDGFFRKLISEKRASGPIVVTHTKNDTAVGIAYPLASRLSGTKASAIGDENDPYGGLGRNGALHTPEAKGLAQALADLPAPYEFISGKVYNLRADRFIRDHNDICKQEVAYAMLMAAIAV
ncbi:hypothetical protein QIH77_02310 [Bradyrhizobium diazoefficiens]|uniref:hypothetical protein n=1 Tax=Bradyrhizobium diazoefficiens TaxID=1355477 RepID=UPI00272D1585|nr:hypothetical protein [Bradyrhizobium diazoefficiens]WLA74092.1 hypothetical protein QIH77_02310 [Bradyrhizobium diazoefficiens]